MASWDKRDGEPIQWYARFEQFRLLGPARTLEEIWRTGAKRGKARRPSAHWYTMATLWQWQERAAAWDMAQLAENRRQFAEEAARSKRERIQLLQAARGVAIRALYALDPTTAKYGEVFVSIRMITDELRNEYDDQPTQRHQWTDAELDAELDRRTRLLLAGGENGVIGAPSDPLETDAAFDDLAADGDGPV